MKKPKLKKPKLKKPKLYECYYCGNKWWSNRNPKKCYKCQNPVGKKPKQYKYKKEMK